tara:strand:- start:1198 stop:1890 length:693 start_codon:yes stop_codon:yes gene_type:complete
MFNHFNKIQHKYKNNIGDKKKLYEILSAKINPLIKNKNILDIGSGGNVFYDYSLSNKIIAIDSSEEMLKNSDDKNIISIVSDARDMKEIVDNSIDVILIIFALHHINGKKYSSAISSLKRVIEESNRKLVINGEIIIVELTLNNIYFFIQRFLYKLTYNILKILKTDMVFFYSDKKIVSSLQEVSNNSKIEIDNIKMRGWLDPLLGTFPGILKIPAFLMPTSMKVFRLKK